MWRDMLKVALYTASPNVYDYDEVVVRDMIVDADIDPLVLWRFFDALHDGWRQRDMVFRIAEEMGLVEDNLQEWLALGREMALSHTKR